jgi:4-alpha-glucanotransferase
MAARTELHALCERLAILPGYVGVDGGTHVMNDDTRMSLCAAMGFDAGSEDAARQALASLDRAARERLVEPVLVWREWAHADPALQVDARVAGDATAYAIDLELENGERHHSSGSLPEHPDASGHFVLPLPMVPALGEHDLRLQLDGPDPRTGQGGPREATQRLVMAPRTAFAPEETMGSGARGRGVVANLYSMRGARDRGHGTLYDLDVLARAAGEAGAAFVGVNPLHAVGNRGFDFAPYSPSSRLYRNPLYLDLESVPEWAESPEARALADGPEARAKRAALRARSSIDHESVLDSLEPVWRALHTTFRRLHRGRETERGRAYTRYLEREGRTLVDFATWEVLATAHAEPGEPRRADWWTWPEGHRDARSAAVARFRAEHAEAVDFRCWLQFEIDRQLGAAEDTAHAAGCALGIYQDLALGASRASADVWMWDGHFAGDVNLGAPPDDYAADGQDWGLPPLDPHRLRADGYRVWSRMLRAVFTHTGVLRIDHAMGLLRQFWIPAGRSGACGGYVRFPASDLLGILALQSRRAGAVVIAEDLGTVPPELPHMLEEWGLLRSAVVHFARDEAGGFRPSAQLPARALCTYGTHDLPPFAGLWAGDDLTLDRKLGRLDSDDALQAALAQRARERAALLLRLRDEGLLPGAAGSEAGDETEEGDEPDLAAVLAAVHAFVARTPCVLVAASLDDVAGERERVNVPGVPLERHASWSRRMGQPIEEIVRSGALARAIEELGRRERGAETGEHAIDSAAS